MKVESMRKTNYGRLVSGRKLAGSSRSSAFVPNSGGRLGNARKGVGGKGA